MLAERGDEGAAGEGGRDQGQGQRVAECHQPGHPAFQGTVVLNLLHNPNVLYNL